MDVVARPYREIAVSFGPDKGLVGVITKPLTRRENAPCVLLLNAGILHRVGASRVHVHMARMLAELGLVSLRFDLSGIGDSARPSGTASLADAVDRDIEAAMNYLAAEQGAQEFMLLGLCSGAYDAMRSALRDPRITRIVLLDILGPFQGWFHMMHHVRARAMRARAWRRFARRVLRMSWRVRTASNGQKESVFGTGVRPVLAREEMARDLETLLARDVRMLFVFTSGVPDNYNHRDQFRRCFPRAAADPGLKVEFLPTADHIFSTRAARDRVTSILRDWVIREALTAAVLDGVHFAP